MKTLSGLGGRAPRLKVFIQNRPPLPAYQGPGYRAMVPGEIGAIARDTGNHWRKVFNVYAKLAFALAPGPFDRWQDFRDQQLLQDASSFALLFSPPDLADNSLKLVLGKGYANELGLLAEQGGPLAWDAPGFAHSADKRLILCPYFDYRQLSDLKIGYLLSWLRPLWTEDDRT